MTIFSLFLLVFFIFIYLPISKLGGEHAKPQEKIKSLGILMQYVILIMMLYGKILYYH